MEILTKQDAAVITNESKISVGRGYFDYLDHNQSIFNIDDIANALSKICRYTGHTIDDCFYSVAEHCVNVSHVVPKEMAFEGLMHDAPEAFIGDVNSVLKQFIGPKYKELDHSISEFLSKRYGYQYPYPRDVKVADGRMYRTEAAQITYNNDHFWLLDCEPYELDIQCWNPKRARQEFLKRFRELSYGTEQQATEKSTAPKLPRARAA